MTRPTEHALALRDERGLVFVHPFDDLDVMAGQGTIALEMLEDAPDLEMLPVPIGGGGLIAGVATAAKAIKPDIHIIGVEPAMYPSFTARMRGLNAPVRRPDHRRGHRGQGGGRADLRRRPAADRRRAAARGAVLRARPSRSTATSRRPWPRAPARRRWPRCWPIRSGSAGKKCGLIITGGNIDPRLLASVLTRETGARPAAGLAAHHRRRPAGPAGHRLGGHRPAGRQHRRGGAQPPGARRAGQGRGVRHHDRDPRRQAHPARSWTPCARRAIRPRLAEPHDRARLAAPSRSAPASSRSRASEAAPPPAAAAQGAAFLAKNAKAAGVQTLPRPAIQDGRARARPTGQSPKPATRSRSTTRASCSTARCSTAPTSAASRRC